SPLGSVIVTVVLLNVALMCTTARLTLRRVFRFLALATAPLLLVWLIQIDSVLNLEDARPRVPRPTRGSALGPETHNRRSSQSRPREAPVPKGLARRSVRAGRSAHLLHALLPRHGLAWALAGPCVGAGPLPADRQALAMTKPAVAADVAQPRDI